MQACCGSLSVQLGACLRETMGDTLHAGQFMVLLAVARQQLVFVLCPLPTT